MTKQSVRSNETCLITSLIAASLANLPMWNFFSAHVQALHKGALWLAHGRYFPVWPLRLQTLPQKFCCQCSNTRRRAAAEESFLPLCLFCTFFLSFFLSIFISLFRSFFLSETFLFGFIIMAKIQ